MQKNIKRRGFFSLVSPFIIYYAVSIVVQVIALMAIMLANMPELIQMADVQDMQQIQQMYLTEEFMNLILEQYMQHLTLVTSITAVCNIPFFAVMFYRDNKYEKQIGISERVKAKAGKYIYVFLFGIISSIGFNNILLLSNLRAYSESYQTASTALYAEHFIIQLVGLGIIVPIAEELMFRGLIYKRLVYLAGAKYAVVLSALVFAVYHGNLVQGIYGFVLGYILAWVYEKYGSIKAPILLHIAANLTSVIATKLDLFTWIFQSYIRVTVVTVICAFLGSLIFVVMRNVFDKSQDIVYESQKEIESESK